MLVENLEYTKEELTGYVGKILRINLTNSTTEEISTYKYVPDYIGGRAAATRIFWDEVSGPVAALSEENKIVYMTGPACGAGLPTSSRGVMVGVCAYGTEQFSYGGMGGVFGSELKYAGYDGFILEGKAPKHTYVVIEDEKVSFLDADEAGLWGAYVGDAIDRIAELHGEGTQAMVIGPAGENLVRTASITNTSDCAAAKSGYGAVFGYKNLKGIAVRGTGYVVPSSIEAVLETRRNPSNAQPALNPLVPAKIGVFSFYDDATGAGAEGNEQSGDVIMNAKQTCCTGCSYGCANTFFNVDDTLHEGKKYSMVNKCLDGAALNMETDCPVMNGCFHRSHAQEEKAPGEWRWFVPAVYDPEGPDGKWLADGYAGDKINYWGSEPEFAMTLSWLCNQYGIDKWEMMIGIFPWLSALHQEGLLSEIDFGMEIDERGPITVEFMSELMRKISYREGIGDVFADGIGRAVRRLGKKKFGDAIYHNRYNSVSGERLDIPVALEACWGQATHWLGRGFQGSHTYEWLVFALGWMVSTRDVSAGQHFANWIEELAEYEADPYHSELFANTITRNINCCELKDSCMTCDFRSPNPTWPNLEADIMRAATGLDVTQEMLEETSMKSQLVARAILMRDYNRTRDVEVAAIYHWLTWPDPFGQRAGWDEFNDLVDIFYAQHGWDLTTGWPFRSTWEKYGLKEIADEMEQLGMLPPEGGTPDYIRKSWDGPEQNCPAPLRYIGRGDL